MFSATPLPKGHFERTCDGHSEDDLHSQTHLHCISQEGCRCGSNPLLTVLTHTSLSGRSQVIGFGEIDNEDLWVKGGTLC